MKASHQGMTTFRLTAIVTATVLAATGLSGCKKSSDDDATPQPIVTVAAEHPEVGEISEHVMADATLSPLAQAAISPKIAAPVRSFLVQRGSKVKAGQL